MIQISEKKCTNWFVDHWLELEQTSSECFTQSREIQTSPEEEELFKQSSECWLCEKLLEAELRDHDHLTGKYRGAACNKNNLNCPQDKSNFVPVFFHNLSGCDCLLIFQSFLTKALALGLKIQILPKRLENNISIQVGCLRV